MKERIKNVLNFKKTLRVIIAAAVALAAVLSVGCALGKTQPNENISAETAIEQLKNSIEYTNGEMRFQIPANYPNTEDWNVDLLALYQGVPADPEAAMKSIYCKMVSFIALGFCDHRRYMVLSTL